MERVRLMRNSVKSQEVISKRDFDVKSLGDEFAKALAKFGINNVKDIPEGSQRHNENYYQRVWVIK